MENKSTLDKILTITLSGLYFMIFILTLYKLYSLNTLPNKYLIVFAGICIILYLLIFILILRKNKYLRILGYSLILIVTLLLFWVTIQASGIDNFFNNQLRGNEKETLDVVTLKSSDIKSISDINKTPILAPAKIDIGDIHTLSEALKKEFNFTPTYQNVNSYEIAADNLIKNSAKVILIDTNTRKKISSKYKDFDNVTRVLYSLDLSKKNELKHNIKDITLEPFNIYISGDDQYGTLGGEGRSDVNIIATVNPKTKQILLTSIPRDYYVELAINQPGAYDKLTHASTMGLNTSVKTIEKLMGIKLSYYVRINFTSLITIVDSIGGITVDNPEAFNTRDIGELQYDFAKGTIKLDGKQALAYSRERHFFNDERMRGKNQQRVIQGIVKKITSPEIIINFGSILSQFGQIYDTNMSRDEIGDLIKMQLDNNTSWNIQSISLNGTGATGNYSYLMPGYNLYVMIPYKETVDYAKECIEKILSGKTITVNESHYEPANPTLMNNQNIANGGYTDPGFTINDSAANGNTYYYEDESYIDDNPVAPPTQPENTYVPSDDEVNTNHHPGGNRDSSNGNGSGKEKEKDKDNGESIIDTIGNDLIGDHSNDQN